LDNLCHTLAGAALSEAGLKRRTRFAGAALMIASNLPDIDVLAFATDTPSVAFRRGWTHGPLAQALLPVLLAGVFLLLDRWRPPRAGGPRAHVGGLLLLGYIGVVAHVGMDWLNTYGVRLLMPYSNQWFYGDAVFIIDPWLWLTLAAGTLLARRARRPAIAGAALAVAVGYMGAMVVSARAARHVVEASWTTSEVRPPAKLMVGPTPVNPFRKTVIVDAGDHYRRGTFSWIPRRFTLAAERIPKNDRHPAVLQAQTGRQFQAILSWARFPYFEVTKDPDGLRVTLADMRFGPRLFRATTVVRGP
jgi:inner membrane protein